MGKKKKKKKYHDPMYRYLTNYMGHEVTFTLESGQVLSGELMDMTRDGLMVIQETEVLSPFATQLRTMVRCQDVLFVTVQMET
ncbi:hypothetical protein [Bacillus tuaregi]|uniref:hypothetical protein n=1 Tax=Bacillus tuaregi TaxID=1816695 RepID=UPI0008F91951|nr:hypothetical protein [Bacillus tuaregi]